MTIRVNKLCKRYNYQTIFKNIDYTFEANKVYGVLGDNGSGKSTFLKLLSGFLTASEGEVAYHINNQKIERENIYKLISYCAPYIQLIEEYTINELVDFHFSFKNYVTGVDSNSFQEILGLKNTKGKFIKDFSSGMKQRLKLAITLLSDSEVVIVDEPATNLDANAIEWMQNLIKNYRNNRLLIVASNREQEHQFCDELVNIMDFK